MNKRKDCWPKHPDIKVFGILAVIGLFFMNLFLPLIALVIGNSLAPYPASIGSMVIWALQFGWIILGTVAKMDQEATTRNLKSRRRLAYVYFFGAFLAVRFVATVVWLFTLTGIECNAKQVMLSFSSLIDLTWTGIAIVYMGYKMLESEPDPASIAALAIKAVLPTKSRVEAGIASDIAKQFVTARRKQYGPVLQRLLRSDEKEVPGSDSAEQGKEATVSTKDGEPRFSYAPVETVQTRDASRDNRVCQFPEEPQDRTLFPGFLRCGCCVDNSLTIPHVPDHDVESQSRDTAHRSWSATRASFLEKPPVGATLPSMGRSYDAHSLCAVCERLCVQIHCHRDKVSNMSWLKSTWSPRSLVMSIRHHDSPAKLQCSAIQCHLCSLLWGCLSTEQQSVLLAGDKKLLETMQEAAGHNAKETLNELRFIRIVIFEEVLVPHFGGFKRPRRWQPFIRGHKGTTPEVGSELASPIYLDIARNPYDSGPIILPAASSTGSDTALRLIKHILEQREHNSKSSPSRLINLRDLSSGRVRIQSYDQFLGEKDLRYVALSHCWGKLEFPKLEVKNYNEFADGYNVAKLPKTFQEAMQVTAFLGINYIWIDSLCIIQDSPLDWNYEAARMADVYTDAYCTIAALAAWDGSEGLFRPQNPLTSTPCLIGLSDGDSPLYAVPRPHSEEAIWQTDFMLSRWNQRGWCLQEQYLSSAIVYFGERQLFFTLGNHISTISEVSAGEASRPTSRDLVATGVVGSELSLVYPRTYRADEFRGVYSPNRGNPSEDGIELSSLRSTNRAKSKFFLKPQLGMDEIWRSPWKPSDENSYMLNFVSQRFGADVKVNWHSIWWSLVNDYSRRGLTKASDKLIAISGLVIFIRKHWSLGDVPLKYMAGLWMDKLISGLLWYVDLGSHHARPAEYRAPSWSWASVDGIVFNDLVNIDEGAAGLEIVDVLIDHDKALSGEHVREGLVDRPLEGTALVLNGTLRKVRWTPTDEGSQKHYYMARSLVHHDRDDIKRDQDLAEWFSPVSTLPETGPLCHELLHPESSKRIGWFLPDTGEALPEYLFCLRIEVRPLDTGDATQTWAIRGLVLKPARPTAKLSNRLRRRDLEKASCFERVGYFELDCRYNGISIDRVYIGQKTVMYTRGHSQKVPIYREFAVRNTPDLDPDGLFGFAPGLDTFVLI